MKILGTGSCLPATKVTNDDLAKVVDTNDEWIASRTGIHERYISKGESTSYLASKASMSAIEMSGINVLDIDIIIFATMSGDTSLPNGACQVQKEIGATNAVCFDLNAACSGFIFALNTAYAYLNSGIYKTALVIGAETLSRLINWEDRSTCVLFGDGAGAVIVTSEHSNNYYQISGSDGAKGDVLTGGGMPLNNLFSNDAKINYMAMDGQEVFKFAVTKVPECIKKVLDIVNVDVNEIKYFILHQANVRIINSVAKRLKLDVSKFPCNLEHYGNTSAASIPILLDELNRNGLLNEGDKLIFSGFGGGLTWGASLLEF